MLVGKTGHGPSCKQDEINALMVGARQGRQARGAAQGRRSGGSDEEIAACREAGIAVEVVPGIADGAMPDHTDRQDGRLA